MARGMPSMVALLGLLAFAGYQNRDKLAGMLGGAQRSADGLPPPENGQSGGLGGILSDLGKAFGGGTSGSVLTGGIGDLIDRFKQHGQGETAESWITTGPNKTLTPDQVADAIGDDNLDELTTRTGLPREELLKRLATRIPEGVDSLTPDGRLPTEDEAQRMLADSSHR